MDREGLSLCLDLFVFAIVRQFDADADEGGASIFRLFP